MSFNLRAVSTALLGSLLLWPSFVHGQTTTMSLDKASLRFAGSTSVSSMGTSFTYATGPQPVNLLQEGSGVVTWTASTNQPWLAVTPASGTGPAELLVWLASAQSLPTSGEVTAAVTITLTGATQPSIPMAVTLRLFSDGSTSAPFGAVDTPPDNSNGVTGAIPITGWALDDIEITNVSVCRAPLPSEGRLHACGGRQLVTVGSGVFIDGARPDVQAAFGAVPRSSRGGWGFMLLTNMLPNQGNGTFTLFVYAQDREGHTSLLGERTITCTNAQATKPFGAIDTPTQGGPASGTSFINFGWVLTPQPKIIPVDGSTITVLVDGHSIGTVDYNHERADIEALFPGFQNTAGANGAVGFRAIDTTALTNGLHTISWTVVDNEGAIEGIGSRFFTVSNGASAVISAVEGEGSGLAARTAEAIAATSRAEAPVLGRRGWDLDGPWRWYSVGSRGQAVIRGEELDRFELQLEERGGAHYTGFLRVGDGLAPLPAGSRLDAATGRFTWAPGVGFVGGYDLVFVRRDGTRAVARHEVRAILAPKGRGHVDVQVEIDTPRSQQDVAQPFVLAGWAADLGAPEGTGIATLHAWAYPLAGGAPVFVGAAAYGGARPDVAAVHGEQFRNAGYGLVVQGLAHGNYDLAVFAWSTEAGDFVPAKTVRVTVR